ncbi:hypothetical protein, partial [Klebsiella pneumoniae]|uniref:hypothetical protein n=1 Tax=Klebsiella pneumoniae TaxID=573 RepID=UPI0020736051
VSHPGFFSTMRASVSINSPFWGKKKGSSDVWRVVTGAFGLLTPDRLPLDGLIIIGFRVAT